MKQRNTTIALLMTLTLLTGMAVPVYAAAPGGPGGPGDSSSTQVTYNAVNTYTSDTNVAGKTISSTGTDENAILNNGASLILQRLNVSRTSSSSTGGDNSSFYGVGAAILTKSGTTYINNSTITTNAKGGAGVFSYSDGVTYVANSTISTTQDTSGGIHAAGGGKLYAWDLNVTTKGGSSAAIRSDRGGGTMVVDGGTYTSNGSGSPAVYCTADISVNDATLTANNSEAICIEGLNSLRLFNSNLTGNIPTDSQNEVDWNVILYQSMSGDSTVGNSDFQMVGGKLIAKNGGMFYTTNTESSFLLDDVDITYADDNDFFLRCTGNTNARGWGSSGSNGADCTFTAIDQAMSGDIQWDSISKLDFYMEDGSSLTGAFIDDESCAGNTSGSGYANAYISSDSTWIVTADSKLTKLYNAGTIKDASGKTVTIKNTAGTTLVAGTSDYTITVTSYSTTAAFTGAGTESSWTDYAVSQPSKLTSTISNTAGSLPATIKLSKTSYTYTGKVLKPSLIVKDSSGNTVSSSNYTVTYSSGCKNVGTYKVKITFKNNYSGSKTLSYKILKATNPMTLKVSTKTYKASKLKKAKATYTISLKKKAVGKVTYTLSKKAKKAGIKVSSKGKITSPKKCSKGSYTITVKAAGSSNYKALSKTFTIKVK